MHSTAVLLPGEEPCEMELPSFPRDPRRQRRWERGGWERGAAVAGGCCMHASGLLVGSWEYSWLCLSPALCIHREVLWED